MTIRATTLARMPEQRGISIYDWMVVGIVLASLVLGGLLRTSISQRSTAFQNGGLTLEYPASWQELPGDEPAMLLEVRGSVSDAAFQPLLSVRVEPIDADVAPLGLEGILAKRAISGGRELPAYRSLGSEPTQIGGRQAIANDYAYLYDPSTNALSGLAVPVVVRAQELLVLHDQQLLVITFASAADDWEALQATWQRIKASIRL